MAVEPILLADDFRLVKHGDAMALDLPDESVDCIVSSPPYGAGIEYPDYVDAAPWTPEYCEMAGASTREMARVLKPGARAWINVMPAVPNGESRFDLAKLWSNALDDAGLSYRDTVVWIQDSHDGSCGWGSWMRPSAPNLRGGYEVILSYFKPPYKRPVPEDYSGWTETLPANAEDNEGITALYATPWTDLVRNVWKMNPARRRPDAPAPFPPELPARCIRLSTWPGDLVLDPFAGSGTTVKVANAMDRVGIGFDIDAP